MEFDLTDLRLFALVAEEGNLTRAALRYYLSLAAVSARMKALEEQAGVPLLYRETRGVRLTPPGNTFLHYATTVLRQTDQLRADLLDYGGGLRGHLRVLANTTAVTDFLPKVLPAFMSSNPRLNVELQEKPNAEIARGILDGLADIGIVAGQVNALGLQAIHFSTDRLVLVTSKSHPFAKRKRVAFSEMLDEDFVGMHQGSTLQPFLYAEASKLGKTLRLRVQLTSFDAICQMIGAGVGIAVLPESAAIRNKASLKLSLIELSDAWSLRERYVLARDFDILPAYVKQLVDDLCSFHGIPSALRKPRRPETDAKLR